MVPSRIRDVARETGLGGYELAWSDSGPLRQAPVIERGLQMDFGPVQVDLENLYLERGHVPRDRVITVRKILGYVAVTSIDQ